MPDLIPKPGSYWSRMDRPKQVRVIASNAGKVTYEDEKGHQRTSWIDRFLARFEPAKRLLVAEIVARMRSAERSGIPVSLTPSMIRTVLRAMKPESDRTPPTSALGFPTDTVSTAEGASS